MSMSMGMGAINASKKGAKKGVASSMSKKDSAKASMKKEGKASGGVCVDCPSGTCRSVLHTGCSLDTLSLQTEPA